MKRLSDIGEFGWIEDLRRKIKKSRGVSVGPGDDAAVLDGPRGNKMLLTTDMLIEGRHFTRKDASAFEIGRKAMAVNVSDIAAMGGVPRYAVISAGLPGSVSKKYLDELFGGFATIARECGVAIVGGDTNRSEKIVISVAMTGEVEPRKLVLRSGAKPGDIIFVSGFLGGSYQSRKHLNFTPRLREAQHLVSKFKINAMMDLSDGLGSDIRRICRESRVGAVLSLPDIPATDPKNIPAALSDGEDFELLFTAPVAEAAKIGSVDHPKGLAFFSPVGRIVRAAEGVTAVDASGKRVRLKASGFDHFR